MKGAITALYRHPIKGFTPERLRGVALNAGEGVPFDRVYAVEDGPSGFDPAAPAHVSKMKFTVLAKIPKVARLRTRFNDATGEVSVESDEGAFAADLSHDAGRASFAASLSDYLGDEIAGPLRVLPAPGAHRFYDHPRGHVSLINLASVRDLAEKLARPVDPLRFRANVLVEGWPAWIELDAVGQRVNLGEAECTIFAPIRRCAATHVDPDRGVRDIDLTSELLRLYGHMNCGAYLHVVNSGHVREGDHAELIA